MSTSQRRKCVKLNSVLLVVSITEIRIRVGSVTVTTIMPLKVALVTSLLLSTAVQPRPNLSLNDWPASLGIYRCLLALSLHSIQI